MKNGYAKYRLVNASLMYGMWTSEAEEQIYQQVDKGNNTDIEK